MENYIVFVWVIFAVFMLICEALTTQLVSIWFVLGGIAAAITCIFTDSLLIQTLVFVLVSLISLIATRPLVKKFVNNKKEPTNSDRLIGRVAIVTMDIVNTTGEGQVNVDGKIWSAKSSDGCEIKTGASVRITAIEGVKLVVEIL
ncbi:MAG: NfeD family protein [Ruminococcus sp.]|nr:NfeD family protein [Ruminococcus sp.]